MPAPARGPNLQAVPTAVTGAVAAVRPGEARAGQMPGAGARSRAGRACASGRHGANPGAAADRGGNAHAPAARAVLRKRRTRSARALPAPRQPSPDGVPHIRPLVEAAPEDHFVAPHHPYTAMLLEAAPRPGGFGRDAAPPAGEIPDPIGPPPPGCADNPRRPIAIEKCRRERPPPERKGAGRVACWRAGKWRRREAAGLPCRHRGQIRRRCMATTGPRPPTGSAP